MRCCRAGSAGGFTLPGAEPSHAPDLTLEPTHNEVRLALDLEGQSAAGSVAVTVRANRAGARTLRLDAVDFEELSVEARPALAWDYDGRQLELCWKEPFADGESRTATIRYRVTQPVSGMRFSQPDEAYPDRTTVLVTDHETERARYWLPCVDFPIVRTTFDFHLTAKADLTILANGTLVSEEENGDGTKTAHWHLDYPCPSYLCCFAVGRFVRYDDESVGDRPIAYFAPEGFTAEQLRVTFGRTPEMMRWLEKRIGQPFPFAKYFQVAAPGIGGAMENISLVSWDDRCLLDEESAPERGHQIDSINVHEMAHSYFGDAIVCRHFEHSWLKESWATYMETVWREENVDADEARYDLWCNAEAYFAEAEQRYQRPIVTRTYNTSWDLFDAHLYPGGAWRVHMLRHRLGDDAFWKATREYVGRHSRGLVETNDFRRILEEHSGLSLTRFFDQWIYGRGYPKLKASFKHDAESGECTLTVEQKQQCSKSEVGLFEFPLVVEYTDDEGAHRLTLPMREPRHTVRFASAGKPSLVLFDPDATQLFALEFQPGDAMVRLALHEAADPANRIRAARTLIDSGTRANLRAVRDAMADEPFWGVRASVGKALGKSGAAEAIEPLAALLGAETDPRARPAIARACGAIRDPRLREALLAFLEQPALPAARAAALTALGMHRHDDDLDRLARAAQSEDLHHQAAAGALRGMGALRTRAALDALDARLPYGATPEKARTAAVDAYGINAATQPRETRTAALDRLVDLTRDPAETVRIRAAHALVRLGSRAAIPALESLKRRHAAQEEPGIERLVAALRKGPEGESKLREQLETLEERCRKLDERVQDVEARLEADS